MKKERIIPITIIVVCIITVLIMHTKDSELDEPPSDNSTVVEDIPAEITPEPTVPTEVAEPSTVVEQVENPLSDDEIAKDILMKAMPPKDWEAPDETYDSYTDGVLSILAGTNYNYNVYFQYILYKYFGEDLSGITCDNPEFVDSPVGEELEEGFIVTCEGVNYFVWWDYTYGYIKYIE